MQKLRLKPKSFLLFPGQWLLWVKSSVTSITTVWVGRGKPSVLPSWAEVAPHEVPEGQLDFPFLFFFIEGKGIRNETWA